MRPVVVLAQALLVGVGPDDRSEGHHVPLAGLNEARDRLPVECLADGQNRVVVGDRSELGEDVHPALTLGRAG